MTDIKAIRERVNSQLYATEPKDSTCEARKDRATLLAYLDTAIDVIEGCADDWNEKRAHEIRQEARDFLSKLEPDDD